MKRDPKTVARRGEPKSRSGGIGGNEPDRPARVAVQLQQEIAQLVSRDLADPRLRGLMVSHASLTPDLRVAKVYFRIATTAQGAELLARRSDAEKALERAKGRLRKAVTARLGLRIAPELRFIYDEGQDARDRIEALLDEVNRERHESDASASKPQTE